MHWIFNFGLSRLSNSFWTQTALFEILQGPVLQLILIFIYVEILQEPLDNITLFSIITIMSFFMFTPVALLVEGVKFTPAYLQSAVSIHKKPNINFLPFRLYK